MDRHAGEIVAVELDRATIGGHQADDHVEAGRLARAVGSEQADDLTTADGERDVVNDGPGLVALVERGDRQRAHRGASAIEDHLAGSGDSAPSGLSGAGGLGFGGGAGALPFLPVLSSLFASFCCGWNTPRTRAPNGDSPAAAGRVSGRPSALKNSVSALYEM